eukprot:1039420-Rhodomonas_salina.4
MRQTFLKHSTEWFEMIASRVVARESSFDCSGVPRMGKATALEGLPLKPRRARLSKRSTVHAVLLFGRSQDAGRETDVFEYASDAMLMTTGV